MTNTIKWALFKGVATQALFVGASFCWVCALFTNLPAGLLLLEGVLLFAAGLLVKWQITEQEIKEVEAWIEEDQDPPGPSAYV